MLVASALLPGSAAAASDSQGSEFWLAFPSNYSGSPELTLFIAGSTATTGIVEIPGLAFTAPFSVIPGTVTSVILPDTAQITTSDTVENLGIHVTALAEVSVYGLNRIQFTTDAYLGLPVDILGTSYVILGWRNTLLYGTEFAVAATANSTTVTITPTAMTDGHAAGVAYTVALNAGQTYQLQNADTAEADLSGTIVTSDKPIAVFGGHSCANIPNGTTYYCDHVVEQLPPVTTWGKSFVTMPLANRVGGDTFRILASDAATEVKVNGITVATLGAGQFHEQLIDGPATIISDKPVLVAQYSNGTTFDNVVSDPFMMLIPPYEQFLASYTVTTPATGFDTNFINLVVPDAAVGNVLLDGVAVPAASYTAIGTSGFKGTQQAVALGSHTMSGPLPFGAFMYGFAQDDSYGYPGGQSLAPIVLVASVVLTPETATNPVNTQHCVDATVTDQNGAPVAGVRVDFTVTGTHPGSSFANTSPTGVAQFCYTGTTAGSDTITASVGTLSDTATKTWTAIVVNPPPTSDADGPYTGTEGSAINLNGTVTNTPATDTVTQTWTYTLGAGTDAGMTCTFGDASLVDTTITCTDDGTVTVKLTVNDGVNPAVEDTATVTIGNANPTVDITAPAAATSFAIGVTVDVSATLGDPGTNDTLTCSIDWGDGTAPTTGVVASGTCTGSHAYTTAGGKTITVTATDDDTATGNDTVGITITAPVNPAPTSDAGGPYTGTEGSPISLNGTVTNTPATDTVTQTWTYTLGAGTDAGMTCAFGNANLVDTTITCTDDGTVTVTLTVSDGVNTPATTDTATVTIGNANPTVSITSPADGSTVAVGATVNVSATITDPGSNDTHTCSIDWGDGTITVGVVSGGTCTGSHAYAAIGVPTITVTATDDDGGTGVDTIMLVVAEAGTKVTGGGWITLGDGKLRFGLVATPDGAGAKGEIQVRWAGHRFHGKTVTGLAVATPQATWSGTGSYDGVDGYTYEVTIVDNGNGGGRNKTPDTFAIVIRDSGGTIVFSTSGSLGGGNLKIH